MPTELLAGYLQLPVFALVAARLAGLIMFQPMLASHAIPAQARALFVVALALLVAPLVAIPQAVPDTPAGLAIALIGELLLGVLLGLIVRLAFVALEIGGQIVAQESGLALAQIADPTTDASHDVLSMFYVQVGTVAFLCAGGHRAVVGAALDTFQGIPLLVAPAALGHGVDLLLDALRVSCRVALRLAAPVLIALLVVNVALGFIGRTVPQLNVAMLGFALKGLLVFALIGVSLPAAIEVFVGAADELAGWVAAVAAP